MCICSCSAAGVKGAAPPAHCQLLAYLPVTQPCSSTAVNLAWVGCALQVSGVTPLEVSLVVAWGQDVQRLTWKGEQGRCGATGGGT